MTVKERIRSDVQDACHEYIKSCRRHLVESTDRPLDDALEDATVKIYKGERPQKDEFGEPRQSVFTTGKTVIQPSQLLKEVPESYAERAFKAVADPLTEAVDCTLENQRFISGDSINEEALINKRFRESLAEFAGEVMDYTGDVAFDEEAFRAAYDQQFYPSYTDREVYDIVIPLLGIHTEDELKLLKIPTLSTRFEGPYRVEKMSVKPLTLRFDNGIRTYHSRGRGHTRFSDRPADVVIHLRLRRRRPYREVRSEIVSTQIPPLDPNEVSVFANDLASWHYQDSIVRELLNTLNRTFHLRNPRVEPGFENGYLLAPNWIDYRESVANIVDEFYVETGSTQGKLILSSDTESFDDFWSQYAGYLTDRRPLIEKPVTRLENMFDRESPEDAILDALIALEGSLLQGTSGSSYTFRLKLRSRLLLDELPYHDWSKEETGDIAAELYRLRGRLIHHDESIEDAMEDVDLNQLSGLSGYEVMMRARILLARIVLSFFHQHAIHGLQPRNVTKAIDDAALNASYDSNRAQKFSQDSIVDKLD